MIKPLIVSLLVIVYNIAAAQFDTSYVYVSKEGKETTKDSAFSYVKLYKGANFWHGQEYYVKKATLKSEGDYLEKNIDKPTGSFNNYKENGTLDMTAEYDNGKLLERTYFYKNGDKKSYITYTGNGIGVQKGWDETGKEIKNYVVEREARFKGGTEGWKKFLEKNLNPNVAADIGAPAGQYTVQLQFIVSREGYVSNVKAVSIPAACKPCAREAIGVLTNSPEWEPAIQHNEPVTYRAIQYITFVVEEQGRKDKKD